MIASLIKATRKLAILSLIAYTSCLIALMLFQRQILYVPQLSALTPEDVGLEDTQAMWLHTKNGKKVQYWLHEPQKINAPMLVFFHGNAGHLGMRAPQLHAFQQQGFGFAILSYRGYGQSEGSPSEEANYHDARQLIIRLRQKHPANTLVLFGESLGTGIAAQMAVEFDIAALVLQAPYLSITDIAQARYPFVPVRPLLLDRYETFNKLPNIHAPLLIFHGEQDRVIPIQHGQTLFKAAHGPKEAHFMQGTGHNNFDVGHIARLTARFTHKYGL